MTNDRVVAQTTLDVPTRWRRGNVAEVTGRTLVFRSRALPAAVGSWQRRILEVADGRPVSHFVEMLYREEVASGAWAADVALWRGVFDQSVVEVIVTMANMGCLVLQQDSHTLIYTCMQPFIRDKVVPIVVPRGARCHGKD